MANVPHASGPYSENTTYGVKKATALEALRRTLEAQELGWISAVSECVTRILNGWETCIIRVVTNTGHRYFASVRLTPQWEQGAFPVSHADVLLHDYHPEEVESTMLFIITEGEMSVLK